MRTWVTTKQECCLLLKRRKLEQYGKFKQAMASLLCIVALDVDAAPAQSPLLVKSIQVTPNIMFTLDNSPSMTSIYMETDLYLRLHPVEMDTTAEGVLSTLDTAFVRRLRSSAGNGQYYDPKIRYLPWANANGTRMANANPRAVMVRPPLNPSGATIDLTVVNESRSAKWCSEQSNAQDSKSDAVCSTGILPYTPAVYYLKGSDGSYQRVEIMSAMTFPKAPGRTDCKGTVCTQEEELQNFANWFQYYRNRLLTAIAGTAEAFSRLGSSARIGYGALNAISTSSPSYQIDGGGNPQRTIVRGIREFSGADREAFFNWLYSVRTLGTTPTKRAVTEVGEYFSRTDNVGPWGVRPGQDIAEGQISCRRNFHVVVTDGVWNRSDLAPEWTNRNYDGEDGPTITSSTGRTYRYTPTKPYMSSRMFDDDTGIVWGLSDVTFYFWSRDLRPDLPNNIEPTQTNPAFWQHLVHYMVGLGVRGSMNYPGDLQRIIDGTLSDWSGSRIDDIWHAAINSRGEYLSAQRPEEFADRMAAIMDTIVVEASLAGVATQGRTLRAGTRKYVPEFTTDYWIGDLYAYELDEAGRASTTPSWAASGLLPSHDARNIVFWSEASGHAKNFSWPELTSAQRTDLGSEERLKYLRGDRTHESSQFRRRLKILGDIVNSAPLYVKDMVDQEYDFLPDTVAGRRDYRRFVSQTRARTGSVFVGANDGMLHVFQDSAGAVEGDGVERFAFIPAEAMTGIRQLAEPSYVHRYFVDGQLSEHHAYIKGGWKSVVLGSMGAGGRSVFALDATTPMQMNASSVLWEVNQRTSADIGHTFGSPASGLMMNDKWVAVFGNGTSSGDNRAKLIIVDLETGSIVKTIDTGVGSSSAPNGLGPVRLLLNARKQVIAAYAGDMLGNVWKFDLASPVTTSWSVANGGRPLFRAAGPTGTAQPISVAPEYVYHPEGGFVVLAATGRLSEELDATDISVQTIYGVWDRPTEATAGFTTLTRSDLKRQSHVAQSTTGSPASGTQEYYTTTQDLVDWRTERGWYLDLDRELGQRTIYPLGFVFGKLRVESIYLRGQSEICAARDSGAINYFLDPLTGAMPSSALLDVNGDGVIDERDPVIAAYKSSADGKNTIVYKGGSEAFDLDASNSARRLSGGVRPVQRTWRQLQMSVR